MPQLPDLHSTAMVPVGVQFEADFAGLGIITQTFPEGITVWCRETQKLYTWNPQSVAGTVSGISIAISTGGAFIATGGPSAIPSLDVLSFGADPTGIRDSSSAIQATITAAQALITAGASGVDIAIPRGNYLVTSNILISKNGIRIYGQGVRATQILFNPTIAGTSCFTFSAGAAILFNCGIENLRIDTSNGTRKIAITCSDTSEMRIRDIQVANFTTTGWAAIGDSSIGLRLQGRELTEVTRCTLQANRPISIENNPNSTISCDHLTIHDGYLLAGNTSDACIKVDDALVLLTNFSINGTNAWVGGADGLKWGGGVLANRSLNIDIQNVRWEQQVGAAGYCININRNIANFTGINIAAGSLANGFFFRNIELIGLHNCTFERAAGTSLNIDSTCKGVGLWQFFAQVGSVQSLGTMVNVFSMPGAFGTSSPYVQFFEPPTTTDLRVFTTGLEGNPVEIWSSPGAGGNKLLRIIDLGGAGTRTQLDAGALGLQLLSGTSSASLFMTAAGLIALTPANIASAFTISTSGFIGAEQGNPTGSGVVVALHTRTGLTNGLMPANTGDGVTYIGNAATNPTASATGGGILYCTAGALTYRGSGGTVTTLGAA